MLNNSSKTGLYLILAIAVIFGLYFKFAQKIPINNPQTITQSHINTATPSALDVKAANPRPIKAKNTITPPISNALSRITKKPFGLKVSPQNSPVSPERFAGFHTGVDFETLSSEQNIDVPIYAICSGPLLLKKWASGYGGVAVQKCTVDSQDVTVIYGHIKLASIQVSVGQDFSAGRQIGILGQGFSTETDGERKHLHLGIHKGSSINIKGYLQNQSELSQWLDAEKYL